VSQDARTGFLSGLVAVDKTMTALIDLKALLTAPVVHPAAQAAVQAAAPATAQAMS
jgi:hypothetical protein